MAKDKPIPPVGANITKYNQIALTPVIFPLKVVKSGKNTGVALGPKGRRYLLVRDAHSREIWITLPGVNESLGVLI